MSFCKLTCLPLLQVPHPHKARCKVADIGPLTHGIYSWVTFLWSQSKLIKHLVTGQV